MANYGIDALTSAEKAYQLTAVSNTVELPWIPRGIWVGEDGVVEIEFENGDRATFDALQGQILPFRAKFIRTGTSVTPSKLVILA